MSENHFPQSTAREGGVDRSSSAYHLSEGLGFALGMVSGRSEGQIGARSLSRLGKTVEETSAQVGNYERQLNPKTLDGARRELGGEVVKINPRDGQPYDHLTKVRNAQQGVRNQINWVENAVKSAGENSTVTSEQAGQAQSLLDKLRSLLSSSEESVPRSNIPARNQ